MGSLGSGPHKVVALVSGGLDSVVCFALAHRADDVRLALFVNYGQRAVDAERRAAMSVATFYGVAFREVDLTWMSALAPEGMRRGARGDHELVALDSVWIPNRNGVFRHPRGGRIGSLLAQSKLARLVSR